MDVPSQRENFNHRNTLSILRIKLKLHFVQNVEPDAGIEQKGAFCKGLVLQSVCSSLLRLHILRLEAAAK
jgi:hypothetical protein